MGLLDDLMGQVGQAGPQQDPIMGAPRTWTPNAQVQVPYMAPAQVPQAQQIARYIDPNGPEAKLAMPKPMGGPKPNFFQRLLAAFPQIAAQRMGQQNPFVSQLRQILGAQGPQGPQGLQKITDRPAVTPPLPYHTVSPHGWWDVKDQINQPPYDPMGY